MTKDQIRSTETKLHLFISYRRQDLLSEALRFREALLRDPRVAEVFLDVDDIRGGDAWLRRITDALARSHCILCMIGPSFRAEQLRDRRDFVRFELLHRRLPLLPLLFEARMPDERRLPFRLRARLSAVNAVTMTSDANIDSALEGVQRVLEDHERRKRPRQRALVGLGAACVAVVALRLLQHSLGHSAIGAWLFVSLITLTLALYVAIQGIRRGYLADGLAGGLGATLVLLSGAGDGLVATALVVPIAVWTTRLRT